MKYCKMHHARYPPGTRMPRAVQRPAAITNTAPMWTGHARWKEFEALCDKYRGCNGPGGYDCAVAVSGGKDSHSRSIS